MKRILWMLAIMLIGIGVVFVGGCSNDDDDATGPTTKTVGDTNDPTFEMMEMVFSETEDMTQGMFMFWMGILDTVLSHPDNPGVSGQFRLGSKTALADTVFLTYHSNTNYWYAYAQHSEYAWYGEGSDSSLVTFTVTDSVQFMHGLIPVQWPDTALLTGINTGLSVSIVPEGTGFAAAGAQRISIVGDIPNWGDITTNGTQSVEFSVSDTSWGCSYGSDMNVVFTNLVMNLTEIENDGCPSSGNVTYNGNANITCTGDTTFSISDNWLISQTFTGDSVHFVVENSNYRWEWTEDCGYQPPTTHVGQLFQAIKE